MKYLLFTFAMFLASCHAHVDITSSGTIEGAKAFTFGNLVTLTVEAESATYEQRETTKLVGTVRSPCTELRVKLKGGEVVATDRDQGHNALSIGGKAYNGKAFVLHADGSVAVVSSGGSGTERAR